jgi:hypothetical protein
MAAMAAMAAMAVMVDTHVYYMYGAYDEMSI